MNTIESNFTQEITLPSQGLLNPEILDGEVVQRCMMVADQKFLSGSNQSSGSALQQLIARTTTSPESFNVKDLTLPDTLYLLFKLRILSYGPLYAFRCRCPECNKHITVETDLSALDVTTLDADYADGLVVTLPHRKDTVYTKLLTNRDIDEINTELKRRKKKNEQDDSEYSLRIAYSIEKIVLSDTRDEDTGGLQVLDHPKDIEIYINSLTDLDASTITMARDSVYYGIAPVIEYKCPECGNTVDISVQFTGDFFRPHAGR